MESEYRKILLLNGLDQITEEELKRFKFLVTDKFGIPRSKLEEATNRTELADLLIQSTTNPSTALKKTIRLFLDLNYRNAANSLQEAKKTVDSRFKTNTKKKGTQEVRKRSQAENCSGASAASTDKVSKKRPAAAVCPPAKHCQAKKAKNMTGSSTKTQKTVTTKNTKEAHHQKTKTKKTKKKQPKKKQNN
ncbi:interferon-inducible protein AIM2-like [Peromyscus leucopus]|uniref:interferon-inducible protein AIM2-like n=1 Tax=Peromyscus leucopus TaxID=10041 RepID=UPI0010A14927|nr:interferon-inducible protein AIM2-like [Peromyscus leucopus]XP_037067103.1 interferon-inducible protein AIM2-like [Peromyscus leucopus]XP_037067104.1 interferon-inducible protein AIM2-like [Peromyscus leucopus]XP_037067105.1 interferon-inducible protein AIM2-like [Peromyscus leucopus]XP_037067106.1 interferon-inducible protein AIM2-like [Peromyscus leucopus]XP_037067107.1 interferon-inducible protein AIM2-like [Peromyscus leucopus]XP_037067108.1 interferon-inducible protein AIM2-like [Pero